MQIKSQRHEDPESKALYEAGEDISYSFETIEFVEGDRTLVFSIDGLTPTYATFSKIVTGDLRQAVKLGEAFGSSAIQLPVGDPCVAEALRYLVDHKGVKFIAIYDGPSGGYKQISVGELI